MQPNIPLIATIGLVLLILLLGGIMNFRKKARESKLLKEFDEFARKNGLEIDKQQSLNKNMIGIDRINQKLLFLDRNHLPQQFFLIDLYEVETCDLVKTKNQANGLINNISLRCKYKDSETDTLLPFFVEGVNKQYKTMRLAKKAVYWVKSVNLFKEVRVV
ncbi:MAG: hypothetical protein ABI266_09435 [Ginsengibacter sp.]